MAFSAQIQIPSPPPAIRALAGIPHCSAKTDTTTLGKIEQPASARRAAPLTVFDILYGEYLPFRLYADYMLGKSAAELAAQFALSEHWVAERIEAMRLCLGTQLRINLLASPETSRPPTHRSRVKHI
ncbi:MAG: hypothetical protein JO108_17045 [Acidobacteriaceae bacterium]|nr:hypothetical protein [Acidobacteriaceae bacterium]